MSVADSANAEIVDIFKKLHQHPELSNHEVWTTNFIKNYLNKLKIEILDLNLQTGVVAEINNGKEKTIALRADIDGLPIEEKSGLDYCSINEGVMHACGHDFHTAALLGAARILNENKQNLKGNVRLIFQPGEENHTGAKMMIKAGAIKKVSAIFGMHNAPNVACGTVALKSGYMMAANDNFKVMVNGVGSHAAMPQAGKDPIIAAANMVLALQTIISRSVSPFSTNVVTVGAINGGKANNIIPNKVEFKGTIRTFLKKDREIIKERLETIVKGIAETYGQTADVLWDQGPSSVKNDDKITSLVKKVGEDLMKVVDAQMVSADDDFALYEELVPGCYACIGSQGSSNLHHDDVIVNPAGLKYATELHVQVAKKLLAEQI